MKPALSAEEWAAKERVVDEPGFYDFGTRYGDFCISDSRHTSASCGQEHFHAIAALCLHNQEFGFTREHVGMLRDAHFYLADYFGERAACGFTRAEAAAEADPLSDLADLIEALLPPEAP